MDDSCERQIAKSVSRKAPAALASRPTSSDEKVEASRRILGNRWTENLLRAVLTHNFWGLMKRGLADPSTSQLATKRRSGLRELSGAAGGEIDADSSSRRASIELESLTKEASKQG